MSHSGYGGSTRAPASGSIGGGGSSSAADSNSANMYRVGDYVFFENSSSSPYAIRRIEELAKTSTGAVEARVMCFYRRSELSAQLGAQADKHHWGDSPLGMLDDRDPDSDDEEDQEVTRLGII